MSRSSQSRHVSQSSFEEPDSITSFSYTANTVVSSAQKARRSFHPKSVLLLRFLILHRRLLRIQRTKINSATVVDRATLSSVDSRSMQPNTQHQRTHAEIQQYSLHHRRDVSELARFSVDLTWARAESERASRLKAYPSPPMSGSPPLPPKPSYEAGERSQGNYRTSHDPYHRATDNTPPHSADMRLQSMGSGSQPYAHQHHQQPQYSHSSMGNLSRQYPSESHDRMHYPSYGRPEEHHIQAPMHPMGSYPPPSHMQQPPSMPGYAPYLPPPLPGPSSMQQGYPASPHASVPIQIPSPVAGPSGGPEAVQPYASPKTQRKTKGHVASACVPCKRAHLRYEYSLLWLFAPLPLSSFPVMHSG